MALTKEQRMAMTRAHFKKVFGCECVLTNIQIEAADNVLRPRLKQHTRLQRHRERMKGLMVMQAEVLASRVTDDHNGGVTG